MSKQMKLSERIQSLAFIEHQPVEPWRSQLPLVFGLMAASTLFYVVSLSNTATQQLLGVCRALDGATNILRPPAFIPSLASAAACEKIEGFWNRAMYVVALVVLVSVVVRLVVAVFRRKTARGLVRADLHPEWRVKGLYAFSGICFMYATVLYFPPMQVENSWGLIQFWMMSAFYWLTFTTLSTVTSSALAYVAWITIE